MSASDHPNAARLEPCLDLADLERVLGLIEQRVTTLRSLARSTPQPDPPPASECTFPAAPERARQLYASRRRRRRAFDGHDIFGEPGWDILLDLYVAHHDRRAVSVSSACIGADVPPTTALRWIQTLTAQALVFRELDPDDGRRVHVRLAPEALERMDRYFRDDRVCACSRTPP